MLTPLKLTDITGGEGLLTVGLAILIMWFIQKLIKDIPEIIRKVKQEQNKE